MIANNLCEKNQQHDPIVKEIVQVSPADCPHYGSAPRSLPHICNRAKMQSGELLRNEFFTMSTLPPTINRHFSCPHKVDLVANDDDRLGVEEAGLPKTLQEVLGLSETPKVGDTEDDKDTVAIFEQGLLLHFVDLRSLGEDKLALLLLQLHGHPLVFATSGHLR